MDAGAGGPPNKRAKSDDAPDDAPVDWEAVARGAQADLVAAREALAKVKAMLSAKLRMDVENERLQRCEAEAAALRGALVKRQADLDAAHTALAAREYVLQRARIDALVASCGMPPEQADAFVSALFAAPNVGLSFETAPDTEKGVFTRTRMAGAGRIRVHGPDLELLRVRKLSVRVAAVLASQQPVPGAIEGALVVPLDANAGATFHNVRFVLSSHAAGELFQLSFELLVDGDGGTPVRVLGVPALLSQPPFVVKSR